MATNVQQQMEDAGNGSVALGAGMMLVGVLLGLIWVWLTFFRRSKSPRNGMTGSSGQVSEQSSAEYQYFYCVYNFYFTGKPSVLRYGFVRFSRFFILCIRVAMRKDVGRFESID